MVWVTWFPIPDGRQFRDAARFSDWALCANTVYNNVNLSNPGNGAVPYFTWPVGIPGPELATAQPLPSIRYVNPNYVYPYTQQANLSIEREVGGQRVRLSYIMQRHTKLFYPRNINVPPASTTPFTNDKLLRSNYQTITEVDNGGGTIYHAGGGSSLP